MNSLPHALDRIELGNVRKSAKKMQVFSGYQGLNSHAVPEELRACLHQAQVVETLRRGDFVLAGGVV